MASDATKTVPHWVLRQLSTDATSDPSLEKTIHTLAAELPESLRQMDKAVTRAMYFSDYDCAANLACSYVWSKLNEVLRDESLALIAFARNHMTDRAKKRVIRLLTKHPTVKVRRRAERFLIQEGIQEVALPAKADGDWDTTGWLHGTEEGRLARHRTGRRAQQRLELPELKTVAAVRKLLGIRSERQLGFLLWANASVGKGKKAKPGPYHTFTIPKRDGTDRTICAPNSFLRYVQRQVLHKILEKVPVHSAAHGFVNGRSTVTNAAAHAGAAIVLKFDLTDFFPTIHFNRVVGLFGSLGYHVENSRFSAGGRSRRVAATLARLCTFTEDSRAYGSGYVPQGAPTSPAISNLVCRRLDARLSGLAIASDGVYTRYADDLTFSFKMDETNLGRFRWWVDQICHQEGFVVNQRKFRVIRRSQRQVVTGIVVNDSLRIPRPQRRRFRAMLHNCRVHGVESQQRDNPSFRSYLRGFAAYIHMVHPEEGVELLEQVNDLLGKGE